MSETTYDRIGVGYADTRRADPGATSSSVPVSKDCTDLFFAALWVRPGLLFDEEIVRPMWAWQHFRRGEAYREGAAGR